MASKKISDEGEKWACIEFGDADFGDPRLTDRLVKIADRISDSPESPINQACSGWAETKAAYRFFQNENVSESEILASHVEQTAVRAEKHDIILAVQDTSYFTYTDHKKTTGLGIISRHQGTNKEVSSIGLIMHTSFAVTAEGLPLGILDQKVHAREPLPDEVKKIKKRSHNIAVPIEDKESIKWLESLKNSKNAMDGCKTKIVTVCDREADFYEFFELANKVGSPVLIRAKADRLINKISRYSETKRERLWESVQSGSCQGKIQVEIPARDNKPKRTAILELRFCSFTLNPPRNHLRHRTEKLPDLKLFAIYVTERHPPKGEDALEWMLLTDLSVGNFDQAVEKIRWYCFRWRIEVFHKVLKSGLKVETCRLQTAQRLIRYLTVMSIIAWRIFWITLMGRSNPDLPCTALLAEEEWKVLYSKINQTKSFPKKPPTIKIAIRWIAQLGGFLGRKGDGEPGIITLWRGWKRLTDLSEGWRLAHV
jgi:hypothetical protein